MTETRVHDLEQSRKALALAAADGERGATAALAAVEEQIAVRRRAEERAALADEARADRERALALAEQRKKQEADARTARRIARAQRQLAEDVTGTLDTLFSQLEQMSENGKRLTDLDRDTGRNFRIESFLFGTVVARLRPLFPWDGLPPVPEHHKQPLTEMTEALLEGLLEEGNKR